MESVHEIEIKKIKPSGKNPRKYFDAAALEELTASVRQHGVLQPIIVRPAGEFFEVVAGERRRLAALDAGLLTVPVKVLELQDKEVMEIAVVENLQRQDLHPLEEAAGYRSLINVSRLDVQKIAERVGRSVKYVYDRMNLLDLIDPLKKVFLEERITVGHAVILSRLTPEQQELVMEVGQDGRCSGLWEREGGLFEDEGDGLKAVSVRELQSWVDEHVKFDTERVDPLLFPDTVESLAAADQDELKVVNITTSHFVQPSARDGSKILGPRSWERADGKKDSKPCDFSVMGVVVVGLGRGDSFKVCISKEKCKTHWAHYQKEKAARVKARAGDDGSAQERQQKEAAREQARVEKARQERERWDKAKPALIAALAGAVKKASAKASGFLAQRVIAYCENYDSEDTKSVPLGKSAEDALRHAAFLILQSDSDDRDFFSEKLKNLGVDAQEVVAKALGEEAPVQKPAKKKAKK